MTAISATPASTPPYYVSRAGQRLGEFPLDAIHLRRARGEFNGTEWLWTPGLAEWTPIDQVLGPTPRAGGLRTAPPEHAGIASRNALRWWLIGGFAAVLVIGLVTALSVTAFNRLKRATDLAPARVSTQGPAQDNSGVELAGPLPAATPTTRTVSSRCAANSEFRARHYLAAYLDDTRRQGPLDPRGVDYIEALFEYSFNQGDTACGERVTRLGRELLSTATEQDPILIALLGDQLLLDQTESKRLHLLASQTHVEGRHKHYPRFCLEVFIANRSSTEPVRRAAYEAAALTHLAEAVRDKSLPATDAEIIAENLVTGWGDIFFENQRDAVCAIFSNAGPEWRWLALTLNGERHVQDAWDARGGGYAQTVTSDGWTQFRHHLKLAATHFEAAWQEHPERPLTAARMIYVKMGQSEETAMRLWFERAIAAQIDYAPAWDKMTFALYPRWHGSHAAILTLGRAGLATGRFDSEAPFRYVESIYALDKDMQLLKTDETNLTRADLWPDVARVYEGYLAEPNQAHRTRYWRTKYACVAYLAGRYDEARTQLDQMDMPPALFELRAWGRPLSHMPLEVRARTGPAGLAVATAERALKNGDQSASRAAYRSLLDTTQDEHTRAWARHRLDSAE
jgi:hypothetical protein